MQKDIIILGAGFSGLSAAAYLAKSGHNVTILEKHDMAGGRARSFEDNGFRFDMGPSWYWLPDVFDDFFADFGHKTSDYYSLKRLDPSYRVFFDDHFVDMPSDFGQLQQVFESMEKGAGKQLQLFLKDAQIKYEIGMKDFVYKPSVSISEFIDPKIFKGALKLNLLSSMSKHVRRYFKDPRIHDIMEFPVLFLGADPSDTPAMYSMMNYADMKLGTWYPEGGFYGVVQAMEKLVKSLGVKILYHKDVSSVGIKNNKIVSLKTDTEEFEAEVFVGSADYQFIDQVLLPKEYRNYSPEYWDKRKLAPSALLFYLGIDGKLDGMLHHNLLFDTPFEKHSKSIYKEASWPEDPRLYLSLTSKTDDNVAPKNSENLVALIPLAPDLQSTEELRDSYLNNIIQRIYKNTGQDISNRISLKHSYAHEEFIKDYNSFKGNAYGLANTLKQTAILKPGIRHKKLSNLVFTGQLTVPGPGVPPSLISGKVAANWINKTMI